MSKPDTILIVEDEQSIADFLTELLSDEGYGVSIAYDGTQALEMIADQIPDLILLDVMMPRMGGEALLQHLRTDYSPQLPIIMMSAGVSLDTFLAKGATAIMAKPIGLDDLLALVATHVSPPQQSNDQSATIK